MTERTILRLGTAVPDFELEVYDPSRQDFDVLSLAEQKKQGRWTVLVFYPGDFTFVCATEFSALAQQYDAFREAGAEVVTVSCDTKFVHLAWHRHEQELSEVRYPMGADPTGALARMFGVFDEQTGMSLRGTFIIDPQGKLMSAEVNFYNLGRNMEELLRKLQANVYLASNQSEACPAQWKRQGDKTLAPSAKMVGRVYEALQVDRISP